LGVSAGGPATYGRPLKTEMAGTNPAIPHSRLRSLSPCAVKFEIDASAIAAIRVLPIEHELEPLRVEDDLFGNDVASAVALRNARRQCGVEHKCIICKGGRSFLLLKGDRHLWSKVRPQPLAKKDRAGPVNFFCDGARAANGLRHSA